MRPLASITLLASLTVLLAGCGTEVTFVDPDAVIDVDTDTDTATDTDTDTDTDADADAGTDTDTTEDSGVDPSTDTGSDTTPPDWAACGLTSECVIAANSCCDPCGQPELSEVDGVNRGRLAEHYADVCLDRDPICPDCPTLQNPWIGATCAAGSCAAFDLRQHPATACTSDADCRLRVTGCCECGGDTRPESLIALRSDSVGDYVSLVCDPEATCPACEPEYPGWVEGACNDAGRCYVYYLPD